MQFSSLSHGCVCAHLAARSKVGNREPGKGLEFRGEIGCYDVFAGADAVGGKSRGAVEDAFPSVGAEAVDVARLGVFFK